MKKVALFIGLFGFALVVNSCTVEELEQAQAQGAQANGQATTLMSRETGEVLTGSTKNND
ncbi:hypothetical protein [Flavobacterium sp. '19STA2R22 D10 B1']|uniref:hypothetical protein n=1 Tax=Flavobacterium aerium TaxID=3037261 RepID=UPI00278BB9E0|nr:hypothetical protein [Flavobacterium sp. '19STA2R22 D10 B1']